eukprot:933842-Pelagomonas_calceolata.AAC.1
MGRSTTPARHIHLKETLASQQQHSELCKQFQDAAAPLCRDHYPPNPPGCGWNYLHCPYP